MSSSASVVTHEVFNQASPLVDRNLFTGNRALQDALAFNAPGLDTTGLIALGADQLGTVRFAANLREFHFGGSIAR